MAHKDNGAVTFQTAEFDGFGRRISKTVTNSGDFDGTFKYNYDGQRIVQVNNGSNAMVQQFIHGTQYIDELVMVRVKDKGDLYVHQDANWNVVGLTDLGRHLVERYVLTPYGELMVNQETGYGDRDGDADVDSTDKGTVGTTCTGAVSGSCRILDLDFDGDYDSTDATKFDALPQGVMHNPGLTTSGVSQPFAHQGLLFEPEIASYQNRAREYDPTRGRFIQRDPLGIWGGPASREDLLDVQYRDGQNLYAYIRAAPLIVGDPTGRQVECDTLFQPGGACAGYFGCTVCDGNNGFQACVNGTGPDPCNPASRNLGMIEFCVCIHEQHHWIDMMNNCTNGCVGKSGGAAPTCSDCFRWQTECDSYSAEYDCLVGRVANLCSPMSEECHRAWERALWILAVPTQDYCILAVGCSRCDWR